ncbi:MAG: VIT1/CCC1 transporter family protein [Pirellulales bacterium]|nr:VIT1/CCC1 transporter family protein [Pirellulales bacterium]
MRRSMLSRLLGSRRRSELEELHTPSAIAERLSAATEHSYLRDLVYGAVDGTVTTFAVVSGAAGANLAGTVAIILGAANLLADGFSMAAGNYLSTRADLHVLERARRIEEMHIEHVPEGEREEIRQIFRAKGFEGPLLERVVDVITDDPRRWVDTMLTEEMGLQLERPSPVRAALTTFASFLVAGAVPLAPFVLMTPSEQSTFVVSSLLTGLTFFLIGAFKGFVVNRPWLLSGLETLGVGGAAAGLSYVVGSLLRGLGGG